MRRIHRGPVNSPHKRTVTRKMFPFDDCVVVCANIAALFCCGLMTYEPFFVCFRRMIVFEMNFIQRLYIQCAHSVIHTHKIAFYIICVFIKHDVTILNHIQIPFSIIFITFCRRTWPAARGRDHHRPNRNMQHEHDIRHRVRSQRACRHLKYRLCLS